MMIGSTHDVEEAKLRHSLARLYFSPDVEQKFTQANEVEAAQSRTTLCLMAIVLVALSPVYDLLLQPPAEFLRLARPLQFGLMIPTLLLALLCSTRPGLHRYAPATLTLATLIVGGGLLAQRVMGARFGFVVPYEFCLTSICATFVMGRLRFHFFAPWAVLLMLAATVCELKVFGSTQAAIYNCLSLWILFCVVAAGGWVLERNARENWARRCQLTRQVMIDALTGLPNRRFFDDSLALRIRAAARDGRSIALLMLDADQFKHYNDHYGHPAGDGCLRAMGQWLSASMRRPDDFCARIGGEEFAAVWVDASAGDAQRLAEELRSGITALGIPHQCSPVGVMTASGGFAYLLKLAPQCDPEMMAQLLCQQADKALYEAKSLGRNRLVIAQD